MRGLLDWWKRWSVTPNNSRMVQNDEPTHVIIAGALGSGGEYIEGANALEGPTVGGQAAINTNCATISSNTGSIYQRDVNSNPESYDAAGIQVSVSSGRPCKALPIQSITADANGNIGTPAELIAAVASRYLDVWMQVQVSTSGTYLTKWCKDPTGTPAAGSPDYFSTGESSYKVAGYPYLIRMSAVTDNNGFGYGQGTNADWPNNAVMTVSGWYREL